MEGARMLPVDAASTSRKPMIGPVHEKETIVSVSAMKNIPPNPADDDLRSVPVLQPDGSVISKRPKKDSAKANSIMKNMMFTIASPHGRRSTCRSCYDCPTHRLPTK